MRVESTQLGEYKVFISRAGNKYSIEVQNLGANKDEFRSESRLDFSDVSETIGWIIKCDFWDRDNDYDERIEAQQRIDNPEWFEDDDELAPVLPEKQKVLTDALLNSVFGEYQEVK